MTRLRSALVLFCAMLREIFDEAAYRRFLQRSGAQPSRASYNAFLNERGHDHAHRQRCC